MFSNISCSTALNKTGFYIIKRKEQDKPGLGVGVAVSATRGVGAGIKSSWVSLAT